MSGIDGIRDLLRDAGAVVCVSDPKWGARVEIRFSELEDAQRLHKTIVDARATAPTETSAHECRPCGYHTAVCCQCRNLLPSGTSTETSARCEECGHCDGVGADGFCQHFEIKSRNGRVVMSYPAPASPSVAQPERTSDVEMSNLQSEQYSVSETLSEVDSKSNATPKAQVDPPAASDAQADMDQERASMAVGVGQPTDNDTLLNALNEARNLVLAVSTLGKYTVKHPRQVRTDCAKAVEAVAERYRAAQPTIPEQLIVLRKDARRAQSMSAKIPDLYVNNEYEATRRWNTRGGTTTPTTVAVEAQLKTILDRSNFNIEGWRKCYEHVSASVPYSDEKPLRDDITHAHRVIEMLYKDQKALAESLSRYTAQQPEVEAAFDDIIRERDQLSIQLFAANEALKPTEQDYKDVAAANRWALGEIERLKGEVGRLRTCLHCGERISQTGNSQWIHKDGLITCRKSQGKHEGVYHASPAESDPDIYDAVSDLRHNRAIAVEILESLGFDTVTTVKAVQDVTAILSLYVGLLRFQLFSAQQANELGSREIDQLRAELATARADAIGECVAKANEWSHSTSCKKHDENPCCHIRTAKAIAAALDQLKDQK